MGLTNWIKNTCRDLRHNNPKEAIQDAVRELWYGGLRRLNPIFSPGTVVWERDWDILVVADACRVDLLQSTNEFDDVPHIRSVGSKSPEWMANTFTPEYYEEMERTAYITGNPYSEEYDNTKFGLIDEVWKSHWQESTVSTMPPRPLTDRVIDVWRSKEEYKIDGVIVHYMQPHAPFFDYPELYDGYDQGFGCGGDMDQSKSVWDKIRYGKVSKERVWEAYKHNLDLLLSEVDILKHSCDADIVLTSDHGNAMGEFGVYGHPHGIPTKSVRQVPWCELEGKNNQEYTPTTEFQQEDDADVEKRLSALGYK